MIGKVCELGIDREAAESASDELLAKILRVYGSEGAGDGEGNDDEPPDWEDEEQRQAMLEHSRKYLERAKKAVRKYSGAGADDANALGGEEPFGEDEELCPERFEKNRKGFESTGSLPGGWDVDDEPMPKATRIESLDDIRPGALVAIVQDLGKPVELWALEEPQAIDELHEIYSESVSIATASVNTIYF